MNFNVRELALAGDLIHDTLNLLNSKGTIDVDLSQIDLSTSAFRALEREYLDGSEEEDNTTDGLMKKGIRFVMSAVYLGGSPVVNANDLAETENFTDIGDDSFAFWGEGSPIEDAWSGKKQIVHSNLMVTRIDQIIPNSMFLEFRKGEPCRRVLIESVDLETGLIYFIDLADWSHGVLQAANFGIVPYKNTGLWNVVNWFEVIDMFTSLEG